MLKKIRIYEYSKCSTCRKALAFLDKRAISYDKVPIVEQPPSEAELKRMLSHLNGDLRKLFNTSGQLYRELDISDKIKGMDEDAAIKLLSKNGKLIKRPFVLTSETGLVGFSPERWEKFFS